MGGAWEGCPAGWMFHGRRWGLFGASVAVVGFSLRLSAFLCRGGLLSVRGASVAVVGFSLRLSAFLCRGGLLSVWAASVAVVGFSLRLSAFLFRGGLLSVRAASVAVVGCCINILKILCPWWAVCLVGAGGTIPGGGPVYLCTLFIFRRLIF